MYEFDRQLCGVFTGVYDVFKAVSFFLSFSFLSFFFVVLNSGPLFFINIFYRYWEVQADIGESIQGWVFWAWKVSLSLSKLFPKKKKKKTSRQQRYLFLSSDIDDNWSCDHWLFAILRLRTQTNGATKRVSKEGGFQVTLPIDYTLEYVLRGRKLHTHTTGLCIVYVQAWWTINQRRNFEGTWIELFFFKKKVHIIIHYYK